MLFDKVEKLLNGKYPEVSYLGVYRYMDILSIVYLFRLT